MQALNWARRQRTGSSTRKAVLLALADQANSDGECWPGQASIAYDLELSERTVRDAVVRLDGDDFLDVVERRWPDTQRRRSNLYRLNMGRGE